MKTIYLVIDYRIEEDYIIKGAFPTETKAINKVIEILGEGSYYDDWIDDKECANLDECLDFVKECCKESGNCMEVEIRPIRFYDD